ncbi:hypothetical protein B0H67DRAFT_366930 [Lasiosphaeris hirsuta]|uniref:Zn(2)-C6 fungal-type domain-containing protein n=1 Tax=Lasiosphaeris hirsuta TaxID=260670 RepID=A0AA39ZWJ6_9PEZI|nr:hypothetical protein B0H67DRAFT_366930 [Lasiosphaeris hirsuta]
MQDDQCQETKPACGHCAKGGLRCEYPTMPVVVHQVFLPSYHYHHHQGTREANVKHYQPQHQIPIFTLQDMRFFQHFLVQCYPHHPIGSENLWLHEVPCLSEKYDYLMHAILGYAASELIAEDPSLAEPAMAHRLKAIKAIKKTLAEVPKANTFEEGNALMATCFALTYQSVLLDDGMAEFMTFIRGIVIVAVQMYIKGAKLLFGEFLGDPVQEKLEPYMRKVPLIERNWVDRAMGGLKRLRPLCEGRPVEAKYVGMITETAEQLYVSSWGAYQAMGRHYGWWMMIPHDEFEKIIDTGSQVATLIATHWLALTQIMAIITETEMEGAVKKPSNQGQPGPGMVTWIRYLNKKVDAEHHQYNEFPRWVEARLDESLLYFGRKGGWVGNNTLGS